MVSGYGDALSHCFLKGVFIMEWWFNTGGGGGGGGCEHLVSGSKQNYILDLHMHEKSYHFKCVILDGRRGDEAQYQMWSKRGGYKPCNSSSKIDFLILQ